MIEPGSRFRTLALAVCACACLLGPARAAAADVLDAAVYEDRGARSYWHASFLGGMAVPVQQMTDDRKAGVAATVRLGWTSRSGLGLSIAGEYSPLPFKVSERNVTVASHLGIVAGGPRFTLGKRKVRLWLGGAGGVVVERTRMTIDGDSQGADSALEPAAVGEAGLELHLFENGGLALNGSYAHSFGRTVQARLGSLVGGLVFTF
jgi:hypothetical protein